MQQAIALALSQLSIYHMYMYRHEHLNIKLHKHYIGKRVGHIDPQVDMVVAGKVRALHRDAYLTN